MILVIKTIVGGPLVGFVPFGLFNYFYLIYRIFQKKFKSAVKVADFVFFECVPKSLKIY